MTTSKLDTLLDEVEALCVVYVRKDAPSESWGDTIARLSRIDGLIRKVPRTNPGAQGPATRAAIALRDAE
jgi:hypothetical protein